MRARDAITVIKPCRVIDPRRLFRVAYYVATAINSCFFRNEQAISILARTRQRAPAVLVAVYRYRNTYSSDKAFSFIFRINSWGSSRYNTSDHLAVACRLLATSVGKRSYYNYISPFDKKLMERKIVPKLQKCVHIVCSVEWLHTWS